MATAPTVAMRALADERLAERLRPFVASGLMGVVAALFFPTSLDALVSGLALTAATVVAALVVPWRRLPAWTEVLVPILYLAGLGYLRLGSGGYQSGMSVLVLLPIVWIALYGTVRQLYVIVAASAATIMLPIVMIGPPLYPDTEWRRVLLVCGVGAMIGLTVQRLVAQVRSSAAQAAAASEELSASEQRIRSVLEAAPDPVVTLDDAGVIHGWNAAAQRTLGWTEVEVIGRPAIDLLLPEHARADLAARLTNMLQRPDGPSEARRVETEALDRGGRRVPVEMSVAVTTAAGQRLVHVFARDVSLRVAVEAAAREHSADLERLLAVARALSDSTDAGQARRTVVDAALDLAGSTLAVLLEPAPDQPALEYTATSGPTPPVHLPVDGWTHAAVAFRTGRTTFVADITADTTTSRSLHEATGMTSGYWQPVRRGMETIGVLALFWANERAAPSDRLVSLLELFAAEVATALERADLTSRLRALSITDPLTGAANRRGFEETLERELARAGRAVTPLCVVMLDLDHFKRYNDERGHPAGDALLREVVAAWRAELRSTDTLGRYGGEEFVAILPDCDLAGAMRLARRLLGAMPDGQTASAGVAHWNARESGEHLVARADAALYASKAGGRNRANAA